MDLVEAAAGEILELGVAATLIHQEGLPSRWRGW